MYLHTVEPKTAAQLLARLKESERLQIRRASADRLEYMRLHTFLSDGPVTAEAMQEIKETLDRQFAEYSAGKWWDSRTWTH